MSKKLKIRTIVLVLIFSLSIMAVSAFAVVTFPTIGTITGTNVNFRTSPNATITSNIIGLLTKGTRMTLTKGESDFYGMYYWYYGTPSDGAWIEKWGYVASPYINVKGA